ncbi:MAG: hypothetical protein M1358_05560 [Chloroflexi bacterium]|nr:hypothetical protein [Chloroflexota bacterium]
MKRQWTIEADIRAYRMRVSGISDDYNYETDALEALIHRSHIQERWEELTPQQREEITRIDDDLARLHRRVADVLPPGGETPDRSQWWWHLDEGPQVRKEAEKRKVA